MVERITGAFLFDAPLKIEALRDALSTNNAPAVAMAAHTLKGGCCYVGAARLGELCAALDLRADSGDLSDASERVAEISNELHRFRAALQESLLNEGRD